MNGFSFCNPTKLIFGKGQISELSNEVKKYGKRVLLVYGGGSIKSNGVYDDILQELQSISAEVVELTGVEPNPRLSTVRKGVAICHEHSIDFILAAGGGSVIDCAKAIAVGAKLDGDIWDVMLKKIVPTCAIPIGTVLTIAATGSEMNPSSVITNWDTKEKLGWGSPLVYPKFSILDPTYTFTLPDNQTVYGIVDMMSHVLESYFHLQENTLVQDRFMESILKTVIEVGPKLLDNPHDYESRETIMYCGTMALNGMISMGIRGDWGSHRIEHAVSAVYDIPHGAGLSIIYPNWIAYIARKDSNRVLKLAQNVFNIPVRSLPTEKAVSMCITELQNFWRTLGAPTCLSEVGITEESFEIIADKAMVFGTFGGSYPLEKEDVCKILELAK